MIGRYFIYVVFLVYSCNCLAAEAPPGKNAWSYLGVGGSDEGWGELSPDYSACTIGTSQSPVAINETTITDLPALHFSYHKAKTQAVFKDHTIVITPDAGSQVTLDNTPYSLDEIRFHSPAEHTVQDKVYLLEIQLLHHDAQHRTLIVSILGDVGDANPGIETLVAHPPHPASPQTFDFDPAALLPPHTGYFSYTGSLSWPPCTESVEWRVLKQPMRFSKAQFDQLAQALQHNARMSQPLYFRTIKESKAP